MYTSTQTCKWSVGLASIFKVRFLLKESSTIRKSKETFGIIGKKFTNLQVACLNFYNFFFTIYRGLYVYIYFAFNRPRHLFFSRNSVILSVKVINTLSEMLTIVMGLHDNSTIDTFRPY